AWRVDDETDQFDPVEPVDPCDVLASRSERTAAEAAEDGSHFGERAAGSFQYQPAAERHDAQAGTSRAPRFGFPIHAHSRDEVLTGGASSESVSFPRSP